MLGSLASSSLSFISIPIIAWMFRDDDIGKAALLVSASGLSTVLFSIGLDQSFTREFNDESNRAALLLNVIVPGVALLSLVTIVALLCAPTWLSWQLFGEHSIALSAFVFVYLMVVLVSRFLTLSLRMQEDGKRYALSFLVAKLVFVVTICIAYFQPARGLGALLVAHGASVVLGLLYLLISTQSTLRGLRLSQLSWPMQRRLLTFGLPVATSGMLFWGLEGVDKFLLRMFSSYSELGVYSIALSVSAMATVLTTIFTTVWIPVVYRWVAKDEDLDRIDVVTRYILAGAVFLVGFTGAFSWLLTYVLPAKHLIVQDLIPACMLWPVFYVLSETTGLGIAITRATHLSLFAAGVALATNVVLNLLMLPVFGARGAAAALSVSIWVFFFTKTELSCRAWRRTPRRGLYAWTLITLALAIGHALAGERGRAWFVGCWLLYLMQAVWIFRSNLRQGFTAVWSAIVRRRAATPS